MMNLKQLMLLHLPMPLLTSANDNLLLDINNSLYYFEVKSVRNDAVSVFIVA